MIDQVDDNLSNWVETVLGGLKPSLSAPSEANGTLAVNLYLLELVDDLLRCALGDFAAGLQNHHPVA